MEAPKFRAWISEIVKEVRFGQKEFSNSTKRLSRV